METAGR